MARVPQLTDLDPLLELLWEGKSLRAACLQMDLHTSKTSTWLNADPARQALYQEAKEGRSDFLIEDGVTICRAAALGAKVGMQGQERKVDAAGARAYLESVRIAVGRMTNRSAPVLHHHHVIETMSDAELDARLAQLAAQGAELNDPDADAPTED